MKLFLIRQNVNNGYDTYNAAVVSAYDEEDAKTIHPNGWETVDQYSSDAWVDRLEDILVKYLGETNEERGVVLASFNAG